MTAGQPLRDEPQLHRHSPPALRPAVVPAYPPPGCGPRSKAEERRDADAEPALAPFLYATVLSHASLDRSLSFHLANKLCSSTLLSTLLYDLFVASLAAHPTLHAADVADLLAASSRDPACAGFSHCLLNYNDFLAVQSRVAEVFAVDIHPAAAIGKGILLDHATSVVIGRDRRRRRQRLHPPPRYAGRDGQGRGQPAPQDHWRRRDDSRQRHDWRWRAKIGAGSVVLIDVPSRSTAVGNPARLIGGKKGDDMPGESMDHTSFIQQWSDYTI